MPDDPATARTTEMESTMTTATVDALRMIEHFHRPRTLDDGKLVCSRCHDIDGNPIDFPCADYCVVAPEGSSLASAAGIPPGTPAPKVSVEVWDGEDRIDATVADVVRIDDSWHVVVTVDG